MNNPCFLQETIHIITFLNKAACNSSTNKLLRSNTEFIKVEMGIHFCLTFTINNEKIYTSYRPSGWYKDLWTFMPNSFFKLEITEDNTDPQILYNKDEHLMRAFVDDGLTKTEIKAFKFC